MNELTQEHRIRLEAAIDNMEKTTICTDIFDRAIADLAAKLAERDQTIARLREVIEGKGPR